MERTAAPSSPTGVSAYFQRGDLTWFSLILNYVLFPEHQDIEPVVFQAPLMYRAWK